MNSSLLVTKLWRIKLTISNCYIKLLHLYFHVTGIVLFPFNSSRALHKIIQSVLAFSFCYMLYSNGHTIEVVNQTSFGKNKFAFKYFEISFKFDLKLFTTKKTQCRDDLSPGFATSPLIIAMSAERFIHQTKMYFVVLSWLWWRSLFMKNKKNQ